MVRKQLLNPCRYHRSVSGRRKKTGDTFLALPWNYAHCRRHHRCAAVQGFQNRVRECICFCGMEHRQVHPIENDSGFNQRRGKHRMLHLLHQPLRRIRRECGKNGVSQYVGANLDQSSFCVDHLFKAHLTSTLMPCVIIRGGNNRGCNLSA